jgi:uncharacterized membrane protein YhaH (DUF805 family)
VAATSPSPLVSPVALAARASKFRREATVNYYSSAFRRYADFQGRASRAEYWMFLLFHVVVLTALAGLGVWSARLFFLSSLYLLATVMPVLALGTRRLHDRGLSGALQLLVLVPFGIVAVLVLMALPGRPGPNNYGPDTPQQDYLLTGGNRF